MLSIQETVYELFVKQFTSEEEKKRLEKFMSYLDTKGLFDYFMQLCMYLDMIEIGEFYYTEVHTTYHCHDPMSYIVHVINDEGFYHFLDETLKDFALLIDEFDKNLRESRKKFFNSDPNAFTKLRILKNS